jgi:hypothetical protein
MSTRLENLIYWGTGTAAALTTQYFAERAFNVDVDHSDPLQILMGYGGRAMSVGSLTVGFSALTQGINILIKRASEKIYDPQIVQASYILGQIA